MASLAQLISAVTLCLITLFTSTVAPQPTASAAAPLWPTLSFKSEPKIKPLALQVHKTGQTENGYLFLNPIGSSRPASSAPVIFTDQGDLVWYGPPGPAFNFRPYTYQGAPCLAYWNGTTFPDPIGNGYGSIVLLDVWLKPFASVKLTGHFVTLNSSAKYPSYIDLHEINITPDNTILVTANNVTQADLSSVGGPKKGWVVDAIFYEIDIATNKILYQWHALDHLDRLPFKSSKLALGTDGYDGKTQAKAWNYFHINAVDRLNGKEGYIISSRYLSAVIGIQKNSTNVLGVIAGDGGGDFKVAANASFSFQHHVRQRPPFTYQNGRVVTNLVLSVFDNANSPVSNHSTQSSGLILDIDITARTATAVARYESHNTSLYSLAMGDFEYLSDGHKLIGYGLTPFIEEFDRQGKSVMTAQFGPIAKGTSSPLGGIFSYRAFRAPWMGCPRTYPALYAERVPGGARVYMSWNGNTEYNSWTLFAGNDQYNLDQVGGPVRRTGFETTLLITRNVTYVQARANGVQKCPYEGTENNSQVVKVV